MTDRPKPEFVENPKLTLYAFHLCHDLALGSGQRVEDSDRYQGKFRQTGARIGDRDRQQAKYLYRINLIFDRDKERGTGNKEKTK